MELKKIFTLALLAFGLTANAASPTFTTFPADQFDVNQPLNTIRIKGAGLTNHITDPVQMIWSVKDPPWNAKGDGRWINNVYCTNGNPIITSANGNFGLADLNHIIMLYFAGTNLNQNWSSGISNILSPTQITISNPPPSSSTNWMAVLVSDDSTPIQNLLSNVVVNGGTAYMPPGVYGICTNLQNTGIWTNHYNSQIIVPTIGQNAQVRSKPWTWTGPFPMNGGHIGQTISLFTNTGAMIVSTLVYGPEGSNFGSVFNFKANSGTWTGNGQPLPSQFQEINLTTPTIQNMWFIGGQNNNLHLLDLAGTANADVHGNAFGTFDQFGSGAAETPFPVPLCTASNTIGVCMPEAFNDNRDLFYNNVVGYFYSGVQMGENTIIFSDGIWDNFFGLDCVNSGVNLMTVLQTTFSDNFAAVARPCLTTGSSFAPGSCINIQSNVRTNGYLIFNFHDAFYGQLSFMDSSTIPHPYTPNITNDATFSTTHLQLYGFAANLPPEFINTVYCGSNLVVSNTTTLWGAVNVSGQLNATNSAILANNNVSLFPRATQFDTIVMDQAPTVMNDCGIRIRNNAGGVDNDMWRIQFGFDTANGAQAYGITFKDIYNNPTAALVCLFTETNAAGIFGIPGTNSFAAFSCSTTTNAIVTHLVGMSAAPTIVTNAGAGTSGATVSISGTDLGGNFTVNSGLVPPGASVICTVTWNQAYPVAPKSIVLTPANSATALLSGVTMVFPTPATGNFTVTSGATGIGASTTYKWYYSVIQ